jgi:hypothetical protein
MKKPVEFNFEALLRDVASEKNNPVAEQIDALVQEANMSIVYVLFTEDGVVERIVSKEDPLKLLGAVAGLLYELQKQYAESGVEHKS